MMKDAFETTVVDFDDDGTPIFYGGPHDVEIDEKVVIIRIKKDEK